MADTKTTIQATALIFIAMLVAVVLLRVFAPDDTSNTIITVIGATAVLTGSFVVLLQKVDTVHHEMNSMKDALVESTRVQALAKGRLLQKADDKAADSAGKK